MIQAHDFVVCKPASRPDLAGPVVGRILSVNLGLAHVRWIGEGGKPEDGYEDVAKCVKLDAPALTKR